MFGSYLNRSGKWNRFSVNMTEYILISAQSSDENADSGVELCMEMYFWKHFNSVRSFKCRAGICAYTNWAASIWSHNWRNLILAEVPWTGIRWKRLQGLQVNGCFDFSFPEDGCFKEFRPITTLYQFSVVTSRRLRWAGKVGKKYTHRIFWTISLKKATWRKLRDKVKLQLRDLCYKIRSWTQYFYVITVMDFFIGAEFPNFTI
jgi:hypothetical protein